MTNHFDSAYYYSKLCYLGFEQLYSTDKMYVSPYVQSISWHAYMALLNARFIEAEKCADKAISFDKHDIITKSTLILSYLFQCKYSQAERLALKIKNTKIGHDGTLGKDQILDDISMCHYLGIIPTRCQNDVIRLYEKIK